MSFPEQPVVPNDPPGTLQTVQCQLQTIQPIQSIRDSPVASFKTPVYGVYGIGTSLP